MNLADVIQRGTRAAQPAATAVAIGTIYFVTGENVLERSNGTIWESISASVSGSVGGGGASSGFALTLVNEEPEYPINIPGPKGTAGLGKYKVGITVDGAGSVLTTGVKGYTSIPVTGLITRARLLAKESGSIVIDVWKDTYANYPPTVADTITASAKPTISSALKSEDTTLTGWTTLVTVGDILGFNIDSVTTITRITLELEITVLG